MKYEEYITNGHGRARGPAQIDSDLSAIRSEMSETLHLLEDQFSPRALIEQLFSGARAGVRGAGHGSSEFVGNLGATIRDNPVPVLLLASGVVSLLAADRTGGGHAARRGSIPAEDTIAHDIAEIAHAVEGKGNAGSMTSRAREVAGTAGERARELRERAGERASEIGERASELRAHAQETGSAARERVRDVANQTRQRGSRTIQEEPLVIVGLGLAIGAMLGAGMPVSERERRMLGNKGEGPIRHGEAAIGRAKQAVQQGVERAAEVATQPPQVAAPQVAAAQPVANEDPRIVLDVSSSSVFAEVAREVRDTDTAHSSETEVSGERPGETGNR